MPNTPKPRNRNKASHYEYEIYPGGEASRAWLGRYEGRTIIISTNHRSDLAASIDMNSFKRAIIE